MREPEFDIAILGAGPAGCALALALRGSGLRIALVGRTRDGASQAVRPIALSHASRLMLERIGAWEGLATTAIEQIHVSQSGAFGRTRISRDDLGLPALGYVAGYAEIARHLAACAGAEALVSTEVAPPARLTVHAEGNPGPGAVEKDYHHTAIVTCVESDRPVPHTAWERFTGEGPLALLPLGKGYGVVWSRTAGKAAESMDANDARFIADLQLAFGLRAGRLRLSGPRASFPLALRYSPAVAQVGELRIGNAAQTLHPVAGQGLNLGLRDAWSLAQLLREVPVSTLGSADFAARYHRTRRADAQATIRATDLLATLYVRRDPLAAAFRGAALTALDMFPPARKAFARRMVYGAAAW